MRRRSYNRRIFDRWIRCHRWTVRGDIRRRERTLRGLMAHVNVTTTRLTSVTSLNNKTREKEKKAQINKDCTLGVSFDVGLV